MRKYYVVYDMTPYDERQQDYIQVGIGLQNSEALIGEDIYVPPTPVNPVDPSKPS